MLLPFTPQRQRIDDIAALANDRHTKWSAVGALPGITIVEPFADPSDSYTCYWYVFHGEYWYQALEATRRPREIGGLLLTTGLSFLGGRGYTCISEPEDNVLVAYQFAKHPSSIAHYGRLVAPGRVHSKFGTGYIYDHAIDVVPNCYGDQVVFLRKGAF